MEFRDFTIHNDLELYVKGDVEAFKESFPGVTLPAEMISEISNGIRTISHLEETQGITAVEEHVPVGFVIVSLQMFYVIPFAYIESIYLEPTFRGTGVVDMLLSKAEEWGSSRGAKFVQLDVSIVNESARKAYERLGYINTRLQMEKPL